GILTGQADLSPQPVRCLRARRRHDEARVGHREVHRLATTTEATRKPRMRELHGLLLHGRAREFGNIKGEDFFFDEAMILSLKGKGGKSCSVPMLHAGRKPGHRAGPNFRARPGKEWSRPVTTLPESAVFA